MPGSVGATSDERGRAKGTFGYDAWGIPDRREADEDEGRASLTGLFGYIGERQDPSSGLVFLRARWYAPEFGGFLSRDALSGSSADPRTQHPYAYAQDNPTSKVDRTGFSAASLFDAIDGYAYDGAAFYAAFPAPASFRLPVNAPAPARPADRGLLGGIVDFAGGFGGGLVSAVKGVAEVGMGVYRSTVACQFGFLGPLGQMCAEQGQANRELAGYIAEDPGRFARQTWDAATENCRNLLASAWSAGACVFDAASVVFGLKGFEKAARLAAVARGIRGVAAAERTGAAASTSSLRIYVTESRYLELQRTGSLTARNPGGIVYATDARYAFGNVAQSNLAISIRGERIAGYVEVPASYAERFAYAGRVKPTTLWEGGGREFTWQRGAVPATDLGALRRIPWVANVQY